MSTAHWGRFELRLCPLSNPSLVRTVKDYSPHCMGPQTSDLQKQKVGPQAVSAPNGVRKSPGCTFCTPFQPRVRVHAHVNAEDISSSQVTENAEFTEGCLAAHQLYLAADSLQPGACSAASCMLLTCCQSSQLPAWQAACDAESHGNSTEATNVPATPQASPTPSTAKRRWACN